MVDSFCPNVFVRMILSEGFCATDLVRLVDIMTVRQEIVRKNLSSLERRL